ncbi:MAG: hypothetical protein ACJASQ_000029 [Crocinitomicaceae bacterium]|jgi:hypothetical protein
MKMFQLILLLFASNCTAVSQTTDTCDYISQNNDIGGLDCYMGSLAPFVADSYQWINCDNLFAPIPGDTTSEYLGASAINVALVVNYLGCIDTSQCQYVCTWGLEDLIIKEVELIKVVDLMGRETEDIPNTLLMHVYSDGTTKKVFRVD